MDFKSIVISDPSDHATDADTEPHLLAVYNDTYGLARIYFGDENGPTFPMQAEELYIFAVTADTFTENPPRPIAGPFNPPE